MMQFGSLIKEYCTSYLRVVHKSRHAARGVGVRAIVADCQEKWGGWGCAPSQGAVIRQLCDA